jgi:hypothetical protein
MEKFIINKEIVPNTTFQVNLKIFNLKRKSVKIIRQILSLNSPALSKENHVNYYYFPKGKISVLSSDIYDDVEIYREKLCYLPSIQIPCKIELFFDPKKHSNVSIISFSSKYTKFLDPKTNVEIEDFNNYLENYGITQNLNNKITITMTNEKENPYSFIDSNEIDAKLYYDCYFCIRDFILHKSYEPDLSEVFKGKEIYKDDVDKDIDNMLFYSACINPKKGTDFKLTFKDTDHINKYEKLYNEIFEDKINFNLQDEKEINYSNMFYHEYNLILQNPQSLNIFRKCLINLKNNIALNFSSDDSEYAFLFLEELIKQII